MSRKREKKGARKEGPKCVGRRPSGERKWSIKGLEVTICQSWAAQSYLIRTKEMGFTCHATSSPKSPLLSVTLKPCPS